MQPEIRRRQLLHLLKIVSQRAPHSSWKKDMAAGFRLTVVEIEASGKLKAHREADAHE